MFDRDPSEQVGNGSGSMENEGSGCVDDALPDFRFPQRLLSGHARVCGAMERDRATIRQLAELQRFMREPLAAGEGRERGRRDATDAGDAAEEEERERQVRYWDAEKGEGGGVTLRLGLVSTLSRIRFEPLSRC